jgi:4-diphosphocytidyl-2-C-methyl-D-erythritol kinase
LISFPNAKINLGLYITEKRPDSYHNLESIFYPVACTDALEIINAQELGFSSSGIAIPGNNMDNLCIKAYQLLQNDFDIAPVHIHLHKSVPIGAGMGGGSADAAFTLKMLNEKFKLNLENQTLENYAQQLGADCAFFIDNLPKFCYQKGDQFQAINLDLSAYKIVLINPKIHISTAQAYAGIVPAPAQSDIKEMIQQPISTWQNNLHNQFEDHLFAAYPTLPSIKQNLYQAGALYASMTGSGSTIYGIFEKQIDLPWANKYWTKWV